MFPSRILRGTLKNDKYKRDRNIFNDIMKKRHGGNINSPLQCRFGTMKMAIKTTKDLHLYPMVDQ
jgi:hypothetical protein